MKRLIIFLLSFICSLSVNADIKLWMTWSISGSDADVSLYGQSTEISDLTEIDIVQWAIAYKNSENTPSTTLLYDFASDWTGTSITIQTITVGGYNRILSWIGAAGTNKTITSSAGGTLLSTIRFTKVGGVWGNLHIVTFSENGDYGCYFTNLTIEQTIQYPIEDVSLPVQMGEIEATASPNEGVTLAWSTESESNSAGFNVWRSQFEKGTYKKITTALVASKGNGSGKTDYKFIDANAVEGKQYWYKIEEISTDGTSEFFGPISVTGAPLPTEYAMPQNYPNPFNPETTVKYELPEVTQVTVKVYTLLGKEVKTLVEKIQNAGRYAVKWNGLDESGRKVPSGVYFVRMQAGAFSQIRKTTFIQ